MGYGRPPGVAGAGAAGVEAEAAFFFDSWEPANSDTYDLGHGGNEGEGEARAQSSFRMAAD